jgi:hypothetical protein
MMPTNAPQMGLPNMLGFEVSGRRAVKYEVISAFSAKRGQDIHELT